MTKTKTDKPRRISWEEWYIESKEGLYHLSPSGWIPIKHAFHANEPYINHLEAENKSLKESVEYFKDQHKGQADHIAECYKKEKDLEARIKSLERELNDRTSTD